MANHDDDGWWDSCEWSWSWWWGWFVVCEPDNSWWDYDWWGPSGDDDDGDSVVYDSGRGGGVGDDSVVY